MSDKPNQSKPKLVHRYRLSVTLHQLRLIKEFVDICSRLLMGQFDNPLWNLFISRDLDYDEFHRKAFALKEIIFPELSRSSSYGVGWRKDDSRQNKSQIGYEIEAMIAHELWKREPNRSDGGVRSHPPLHYSDEELIRIEEITPEIACTSELLNEAGHRILENAVVRLLADYRRDYLEPRHHDYLVNGIDALERHLAAHFTGSDGSKRRLLMRTIR